MAVVVRMHGAQGGILASKHQRKNVAKHNYNWFLLVLTYKNPEFEAIQNLLEIQCEYFVL